MQCAWGGNERNDHRRRERHAASSACAGAVARAAQARARRDGRRHRRAYRAGGASAAVAPVRQREGRAGDEPRPFQRGSHRPALSHRAQELAHPRRLDRAVQPDHRAVARLGGEPHRRSGKAADPDHRDALLSLAAVSHRHRLHLSVQPQCRADQRADARRRRASLAHLQRVLHAGTGAGHGAAHVSLRLSAGLERAAFGRRLLRGSGADPRRQQAAHRAVDHGAAGCACDPVGDVAGLRQCTGAVRVAGDHRVACPHLHDADADLCAVRLSAGIWSRFRALAGARADHRGRALPPARVSGAALLCDARRQGIAAATHGAGSVPLAAARVRRADLHRIDRGALCDS